MNIAWFSEIHAKDIASVGGKGANLGEMYNAQMPVPPGFVITSEAYKTFIKENKLDREISSILETIDYENNDELQKASEEIQKLILKSKIPEKVKQDIVDAYNELSRRETVERVGKQVLSLLNPTTELIFVAVRSSATAEDLAEASFAGQQASFLNIREDRNLTIAVKQCWASLFTGRAIYYRAKNHFDHMKVYLAIVVQKMVNSKKSGVMFTINPTNNNKNEIVIEGGFGLGEAIVSGAISPNLYIVDKRNLKLKTKKITKQEWLFTRDNLTGNTIKKTLPEYEQTKQVLEDSEIKTLAEHAVNIEEHYGRPQDIEWAIEAGKTYIVQSRPITTENAVNKSMDNESADFKDKKVLLKGLPASPGIGSGKVKKVTSLHDLGKVLKGDVLVAKMTNPDYVPAMQRASAIVTDEGGLTSHAAIVSREMGIPCIVGTEKATKILEDNQEITVDGGKGNVYDGIIHIKEKIQTTQEKELALINKNIKTVTNIYVNLSEPEQISKYKDYNMDGIGLMRVEFIITDTISKHPLYMIKMGQEKEYIRKLAEGISKVAEVLNPRPIIVRFSDFKTNEYKNLEGGSEYEPVEQNPMIGWRGVSRYVSDEFQEAFRLECKAIKKVREFYKNVHVMMPFVRTVDEVEKCLAILDDEDLKLSKDFKIYLMAEVPSIAFIPDEFAKLGITGTSIGSNDLTQLVLGVDRDSAKLGRMGYFDERNPAVLRAIENIITHFHKYGKTVSICGQAPSEYPEIVEFLVRNRIDAISVNPDKFYDTKKLVSEIERNMLKGVDEVIPEKEENNSDLNSDLDSEEESESIFEKSEETSDENLEEEENRREFFENLEGSSGDDNSNEIFEEENISNGFNTLFKDF